MTARALTARQQRVLADLPADQWVRPMDIGGANASAHSEVLAGLARRGLVERRRRDTMANMRESTRGSYEYRAINRDGAK